MRKNIFRIGAMLICSLIICMGCGNRADSSVGAQETNTVAEVESTISGGYEDDSIVGEYYSPEDVKFSVESNGDGTYAVEIGIYRLTTQDDGVGRYVDGEFAFTATDASGNPMKWKVVKDGDIVEVTVVESTWDYLPVGESFQYTKR